MSEVEAVTLKFEVTVEVHPEAWAREYLQPIEDAVKDAREYLPHLLVDRLSRQMSWGVISNVKAEVQK